MNNVLVSNLEIPWGIDFFPNGDFIVTERPGRVKIFSHGNLDDHDHNHNHDHNHHPKLIQAFTLSNVYHAHEGGLLGVAIDPSSKWIYFYYSHIDDHHDGDRDNIDIYNRVIRTNLNFEKVEIFIGN